MYVPVVGNEHSANRTRQSLSASNHFLAENRPLLQDTVARSRSLRNSTFPSLKVPESIFEGRGSGAFLDGSSTIGSAEFDFDDDVVNSTVYRRAMAAAKQHSSTRRKVKSVVEGDLIDLSEVESDDDTEIADSSTRDLEELVSRGSSTATKLSHTRSPTMETLQEENEARSQDDSPRSNKTVIEQRGEASNTGLSHRVTSSVRTHPYPQTNNRAAAHTPTLTMASNSATIDSESFKSAETRYGI
jgi:hypothetical protein